MDRSASTTEPVTVPEPRHPLFTDHLYDLSLATELPSGPAWERFLNRVEERYRSADDAADLTDGHRGWSSFENLFRMSPTPTMEQDYSGLMAWMDELRSAGVTDIRPFIDGFDEIRSIVPMIRIVAANPAAVRAVGLPLEQLLGPCSPLIVNEESVPGWIGQIEAVWTGTAASTASFVAATAAGRRYDAETTLSAPIIDGKPDFTRAVFTVSDVTDHRNEERRMQTLVEAKNQFLASVSHEIRTPLTAVLGFARVLSDDVDSLAADDLRLMVSSIAEQAQDVANLVEDLLVAARAEAGEIDVAHTAFDVVRQVRDTLDVGGSHADGVSLVIDVQPLSAVGDPPRFRQILRNLLTNAERYGGADVAVILRRRGDTVEIDVTDDGPGIPRSDWDRVFEPYQTAHQSPGRPGSVGIGLAISRQLAQLMGGGLDYRHEGGRSVFRLWLAAADR